MTKENAKELRMDLAKDALALLTLHGKLEVQFHGGGEERRPPPATGGLFRRGN